MEKTTDIIDIIPHEKLRICLFLDKLPNNQKFSILDDLPEKLVESGSYYVTLLSLYQEDFEFLKKYYRYRQNQVHVVLLDDAGPLVSSLLPAVHSYHVMQWMLKRGAEFDIVLFPLTRGIPYYTLLAKHQGWAFQETLFCVNCLSSTLWNKHLDKQWIDQIDDLAVDFLEKESVRLADHLIYHKNDWLDSVKKEGWQLPKQVSFFSEGEAQTGYLSLFKQMGLRLQSSTSHIFSKNENEEYPLVSVCLTHFNRSHYLAQALASIRAQDYPYFEVILVDDASTEPEAIAYLESLSEEFQSKGWKIIRNSHNLFPGAARNLAVSQSNGDYLLFMDDDNYAKTNQISTFVRVAKYVGADMLTCAMDVFMGPHLPSDDVSPIHRFLPLGAAASLGLYLNLFGDMNALIKKRAYIELGGLTEEREVGGEDWEFFSRAVLKGYHLETIPLALFWYRDTPSSITKTTHLYANSLRGIKAYLDSVPTHLRSNLVLSQAQQDKLQKLMKDYNDLGKLLKRCWELFFFRAQRAVAHPRRTLKKILKKCGLRK